MDPTVTALLREREHYLRRGLPERAAEVDAELSRLGHTTTAADTPEPSESATFETTAYATPHETAVPPRPRPRKRDTPNAP